MGGGRTWDAEIAETSPLAPVVNTGGHWSVCRSDGLAVVVLRCRQFRENITAPFDSIEAPDTIVSGSFSFSGVDLTVRTILLLLALTLPLFVTITADAAEPLKLSGATMGTYYSIVIDSPAESLGTGKELQTAIDDRLQQINAQMSTWDEASETVSYTHLTLPTICSV